LNEEISPLKIFIGYDSREDIAYQTAKLSIEKHASVPVEIIPLKLKWLKKSGVYTRPVDKLASTEFTFTRFLIPHLTEFKGWALFIDCDFIFLEDVAKLFAQTKDEYAVMCAQHDYTPAEGTKMDGQQQHQYPRKNWSSMMMINCSHPSNAVVTNDFVNNVYKTGAYFHRFSWLNDEEIGKLSHEWNWLVEWYKAPKDGTPKALHYTEGGPWFKEYQNCEYAFEWYKIKNLYNDLHIDSLTDKISKLENRSINAEDLTLEESKKKLVINYIKNLVDPEQNYYKIEHQDERTVMGNKVAAIDSVGGVSYTNKGLAYDSYLTSFILGSGGRISSWEAEKETDAALVIRGLGGGSQKAIKHCWETNRTFYAIDTGYFGNEKKKEFHRVTKNGLQFTGPLVKRDTNRLSVIDYRFKPFTPGRKILICPPSEKVMNLWGQSDPETWTKQIVEELKSFTDRPIEVRLKPIRSERITTKTMEQALSEDVHCIVTYNSIAATEALMNGKPAIALGPNAASVLCDSRLSSIEKLKIPDQAEMFSFVCNLSYAQFSQAELQDGTAWRIINEGG
jgi:lipopolysaccharide biosynthesis glycosyltransferase